MDSNIKQIQSELLILVKQFHSFCMKNNIYYSIHGGTMLGAVREKGFIEWDDDIDITITRKEYDKFLKYYSFETEDIVLRTNGFYPRLIMKRDNAPVVWLDIFIYDYITNNRALQIIKITLLKIMILMFRDTDMLKFTKKNRNNNIFRYIVISFLVKVGKIIDRKILITIADRIMKSFQGSKMMIHRSNDSVTGMPIILPAYVMDSYVNIQFENTELMISKYWHEILLSSYGKDYMTPKKTKNEENLKAFNETELKEAERLFKRL